MIPICWEYLYSRRDGLRKSLPEVFNPTGAQLEVVQSNLSDTKSTECNLKQCEVDFKSVSSAKLAQGPGIWGQVWAWVLRGTLLVDGGRGKGMKCE